MIKAMEQIPAPPAPEMEKTAIEPLEPTKPPEIDPETTASAANAVEQWRNYQQAYAAYQQQCAAYQYYLQQTQYAQTVEQQQLIYSQYLEQHRHYQYQLQQYEQYKQNTNPGTIGYGGGAAPAWPSSEPMQPFVSDPGAMMQQPLKPGLHTPVNGVMGGPGHGGYERRGQFLKRGRDGKHKSKPYEKKNELHMKTTIYLNPEDEKLLPADLKQLFGEFHCNLCRTRMNSHISANIHYQSKAHEKKINQWLKEYCTETGTPMPVRQRPLPELAADANPIGKSVFHCEACDLVLTSVQHANQHYTGKRHWMVVNGKKLPSGNGHYNAEGKWIRATNIVSAVDQAGPSGKDITQSNTSTTNGASNGVKNPRLEPPPEPPQQLIAQVLSMDSTVSGSEQQQQQQGASETTSGDPVINPKFIVTINIDSDDDMPDGRVETTAQAVANTALLLPNATSGPAETTLEQEIRKKEGLDCVDDTGTFCLICETSVTSRSEMLMHLKGAKHLKKARSMGVVVRTTPFNASDTILRSLSVPARQTDWSLYRIPSGKFYCKTCNLIVADEKLFGQHWYGKKHKLKLRQEQLAAQTTQEAPVGGVGTVGIATESPFVLDDHDVPMSTDPAQPVAPMPTQTGFAPKPLGKRGKQSTYFTRKRRFFKPRPSFPSAPQQQVKN
uniref:C2H2-type domain-containing protein n=1 Tax=Anopheles farauti TaxID=69004 RepID=A0A182Q8E4_9DIPT